MRVRTDLQPVLGAPARQGVEGKEFLFTQNDFERVRRLIYDRAGMMTETIDKVDGLLAKHRKLISLVEDSQTMEVVDEFSSLIQRALERYHAADREDVQQVIKDRSTLSLLRRDALRSIENLRTDQFLTGGHEADGVTPRYNETIHQWWNINSLLAASVTMPSGVSLNLIRDPDAFQSYFCFAIRNGANLFILSDFPDLAHPMQGQMTRRPDRRLQERASRNWFPYELLDLEYSEDGKRMYEAASKKRSIVAYQSDHEALPLKKISDMPAEELVWTSMMFDLIIEKFWHQKYNAPTLSYTAEMVKSEHALIERAKTSNLPAVVTNPLAMPSLTISDVLSENNDEESIGKKVTQENLWMEKRYAHLVSEDTLNLVTQPDEQLVLDLKTSEVHPSATPGKLALHNNQEKNGTLGLQHLNATSFGSKKEIEQNRRFIARYNFASQIKLHAHNEFESRKDEVLQWYRTQASKNLENLIDWAGNEHLWIMDGPTQTFDHWKSNAGRTTTICLEKDENGVPQIDTPRVGAHSLVSHHGITKNTYGTPLQSLWKTTKLSPCKSDGTLMCQFNTDIKASTTVVFYPTNSKELALLAGCDVSDLPDVLQHWDLRDLYKGNSILNRIDPMLWVAKNPWQGLDLRLQLGFSKRAMKELKKRTKLPHIEGVTFVNPEEFK